ncbi:hypothetical protein MNBD_GAMMA05-632 [hydrothermal vent metagenome]|uniref:Thymidylate kinase-like domain-containing protein n=1 Tax=hydrothermal vent metagenome TaxID=652676 RepID=A0A3B0WHY7_9ZZZZ
MGIIISVMGIDGCGKSTLSIPLAENISSYEKSTINTWATLKPVLLKPVILLTKFLFVRKHNKFDDYDKHIKAKNAGVNKLKFTHKIYFMVMLIDYIPQAFFKVTLPKMLGKYVICDRYYHDLIIDYAITISLDSKKISPYIKIAEFFVPKPDLQYYLHVESETSLSRKDDIPSIAYLEQRKSYYDYLAEKLDIKKLSGEDTADINCQHIINDLKKRNLL